MAGNCCLESNESDDGGIKEEAVLHVGKGQKVVKRVKEVTNVRCSTGLRSRQMTPG